MRFHYIGEIFDAREDAAELIKVFDFDDNAQIGETSVDVDGHIGNVDTFAR